MISPIFSSRILFSRSISVHQSGVIDVTFCCLYFLEVGLPAKSPGSRGGGVEDGLCVSDESFVEGLLHAPLLIPHYGVSGFHLGPIHFIIKNDVGDSAVCGVDSLLLRPSYSCFLRWNYLA